MCDQFGLEHLGKDSCDSIRSESLFANGKEGFDLNDVKTEFDRLQTRLRSLDMEQEVEHGISESSTRGSGASSEEGGDTIPRQRRSNDLPMHPDLPLSGILSSDTEWRRAYHPETRLRHVTNLDGSPGPLAHLIQSSHEWEELNREEENKLIESFKNLKTGAPSVTDPDVAAAESPLGDATLLPIIHLRDLKYMNPPAKNWVGLTPTHAGFQYVQQAYQDGKWYGARPDFKLPKAYRRLGYKTMFSRDARSGPSQRKRPAEMAKDGTLASEPMDIDQNSNQQHNQSGFRLTRGPGGDKFEFFALTGDQLRQELKHCKEEYQNGGREKMERQLAKHFRDIGLDASYRIPQDSDTSDSDSFISSDSSPDEEMESSIQSSSHRPTVPTKRHRSPGSITDLVSQKKAKVWFESL